VRGWLISDIAVEKEAFRHISISPDVFSCAVIDSVHSWGKTHETHNTSPCSSCSVRLVAREEHQLCGEKSCSPLLRSVRGAVGVGEEIAASMSPI